METMDDFSKDVMREIRDRGITPRPFWYFLVRRGVFWTLATLSVCVGAVALSVAAYVFFDTEGSSSEALIASPIRGILEGAPVAWLLLFILSVLSAYLTLKRAHAIYAYRTFVAVLALAGATLVLGAVFAAFDVGHAIHYYLAHDTTLYQAVRETRDGPDDPF